MPRSPTNRRCTARWTGRTSSSTRWASWPRIERATSTASTPRGSDGLARLAAAAGVARVVHISAIGADPDAASRYAATKGIGEALAARGVPHGDDPAPVAGVRPGGRAVQPLRRNGAPDADHAGDLRRYPIPAGLCGRRGRCGDGRIGAGGRCRHDLRTRRPACPDVPGTARLHPEGDRPEAADWWTCRWGWRGCRRASWNLFRASR